MRIICTGYGLGKGKNSPPFYYFPFFMHLSAERQGGGIFQLGYATWREGKQDWKDDEVFQCLLM